MKLITVRRVPLCIVCDRTGAPCCLSRARCLLPPVLPSCYCSQKCICGCHDTLGIIAGSDIPGKDGKSEEALCSPASQVNPNPSQTPRGETDMIEQRDPVHLAGEIWARGGEMSNASPVKGTNAKGFPEGSMGGELKRGDDVGADSTVRWPRSAASHPVDCLLYLKR